MLNLPHQSGWFAAGRSQSLLWAISLFVATAITVITQIDPVARNQMQLGYDQPVTGNACTEPDENSP